MSTQTGAYVVGTYGEPILVRTGVQLVGATAVNLKLTRPDGTIVTRDIGTSSITNAVAGEVTYTPTQSDLTIPGTYTFSLTIPMSGPKQVVAQGTLTVAPLNESSGALVVEDGTGLATSNSYASVAEANVYHNGNLYADTWQTAPMLTRERALIMATRVIDSDCRFNGYRKTQVQALEWPRVKVRNPDYIGTAYQMGWNPWVYYDENSIPRILKQATAQAAVDLMVTNRTADSDTMGIHSLGIGSGAITMAFDTVASNKPMPLTQDAQRMLAKIASFRYGGGGYARVRRV